MKFLAHFSCVKQSEGIFRLQSQILLFSGPKITQARTQASPLVPYFPTCQDTFFAASLMASSSWGDEPLTSAQIWSVAKIRPVQRTQILFTITLTRPELAGLHLCVTHRTHGIFFTPIFLNTCSIYTTGMISYLRLLQSYALLQTTETITSWNLCAAIEVNPLGYVQACHTTVLSFHDTITKTCKGFFLTVVQNVLSSRN